MLVRHIYTSVGYCLVYFVTGFCQNLFVDKRTTPHFLFVLLDAVLELVGEVNIMCKYLPEKISKGNLTLVIALLTLGAGEYLKLKKLTLVGIHLCIATGVIQIAVLIGYLVWYWQKHVTCKNKENKDEEQNRQINK